MIILLKKVYRLFIKRPFKKMNDFLNKKGNKRKCYVCQNTFNHFTKYKNGSSDIPEFLKQLKMVGSDVDNFGCIYCGAHDRERHLFMFFDKLLLWDNIKKSKILHFAPEKNLSTKITALNPYEYTKADLNPKDESIKNIDATKIPYSNDTFDLIICNHVLEHIPDYLVAIREIYRILKPNGIAILQTPYSKLLSRNFEDDNINTDEQRLFFYGQKDHFRIFSEKHFFNDLEKTGFILRVAKNSDFFDARISYYYGINKNEDLIKVTKPSS